MEELSSLLVVAGAGGVVATFATVVLGLLISIYLNTRKEARPEEDEALVIPYSALMNGAAGGGGGQTLSIADVMRARAAMAAAGGGAPPDEKDKKDKPEIGGQYL